jgi:branched-chain amino acid transport system substrate-binding protein
MSEPQNRPCRVTRRRLTAGAAAVVALALTAAACGSSSKGTSAGVPATTAAGAATTAAAGGTTTTAAAAGGATTTGATPLDKAGAADDSLPKLKIGFINQEAGSAGTYPENKAAAEAAVQFINKELGGVGKHAIELDECVTDGTVASSQKCAQQMVNDKVTFVTGGLDNNMQGWYPILDPAGVPVIGGIPVAGADFNAANGYFFVGGGATTYPGLAAYIIMFMPNVKKVGVLANDTPGAAAALPLVTKPLQAKGVTVSNVKVPVSQADWLAPFASVKDNDAVAVLVGSANCISLAKARDSQQSTVPMVSVSACYSQATVQGAGQSALNGWTVNQNFDDPQGDSPDAKTFQDTMHKYAGANANLSGFAPVVFNDLITLYTNILKPLGYEGSTTDKIVAKVKDPAGGKVFMGPTYKCAVTGAPFKAICNYYSHWFAIKEGKLTNPTPWVDLTDTIKVANA